MGRAVGRVGLGLALAVVLTASGCTTWQGGVPGFLHNRAMDAMRCVDFGVTTTSTPQFSFYAALLSFAPFGYGKVDGQFTGIGGGDIGSMKIHYEHWGVVAIGHEQVGWGNSLWDYPEFDPNTPDDRMDCQGVGIVGFVSPPYDGRPNGRPTWTKYFHVGYVGIIINAHFAQMMDFAAGFMGLDPAGNDGHKYGYWPWQIEGWPTPTGTVFPYAPVAAPAGEKPAPVEKK